jgi:hypothetical protein
MVIICCLGILGFVGYYDRWHGNIVKEAYYVHVLQRSTVTLTSI